MIVRLIDGLLAKTNSGELQWTKTDTDGSFRSTFTDYSVEIASTMEFNPDLGEPDEEIKLRILNGAGALIEQVSYNDFDKFELGGEEYPWRAFLALHRGARRSALGMTEAITSIVEQLLGADAKTVNKDAPEPADPNDIPF